VSGAGVRVLRRCLPAAVLALAAAASVPVAQPALAVDKPEAIGVYLARKYDAAGAREELRELGSLGVNLAINYSLADPYDKGAEKQAQFQDYLDTAAQSGVGISYYIGRYLIGATPETYEEHALKVLAAVERLKGQRAIASWYMHDELWPSIANSKGEYGYALTLEQMLDLYQRVHEADPRRDQLCVWDRVRTYKEYQAGYAKHPGKGRAPGWLDSETQYEAMLQRMVRGSCDVAMIDIYPVGKPRVLASQVYAKVVRERTARLKELTAAGQPVYLVFQAFSLAQTAPKVAAGSRFPTKSEMEAMLTAGHAAGASGAIAYAWYNLANPVKERDIAGRAEALDTLREVLAGLAEDGWP
jgi:hypothetical protein